MKFVSETKSQTHAVALSANKLKGFFCSSYSPAETLISKRKDGCAIELFSFCPTLAPGNALLLMLC